MSFLTFEHGEKRALERELEACVNSGIAIQPEGLGLAFPRNFIEWAAHEDFLGLDRIFSNRGQYYALREYFQCYCPVCTNIRGKDIFEVSEKALRDDALLEIDWVNHTEFCPKCGGQKEDFLAEQALEKHNMMLGIVGMRAGKTTLAAIMMSIVEMFLISLGDAKKVMGLENAPFIEIACIAVSAQQARDTIWAQFKELRTNSPWYQQLNSVMAGLGHVKTREYDISSDGIVKNNLAGYKIISLNSSSASIAGRTRVWYTIDELGRFDTTESKRSASEIWRVGNSSLKTIRKIAQQKSLPFWLGSMIAIESPISVDDYGMQMMGSSSNVKHMFRMKFATWEFNREYEAEDFDDEFSVDFHGAKRDFGADPPGAEIPFIEDWDLFLKHGEDKMLMPLVQFDDIARQDGDITYVGKRLRSVSMDQDEWIIAGDAGKTKDTFALAGAKKIMHNNGEFEFVIGFVMHILPDKAHKKYVDFTCVEPILETLCQRLRVTKICFDYWNSELMIQSLRKKGIPAEQYSMSSVKIDDYWNFTNDLPMGRIKLLPRISSEDGEAKLMDSQTRFYWEMKRMQRSKDLKRVDHSDKSTSDIVECVVNCYRMAASKSGRKGQEFESNADQWGNLVKMRRWR